jgi:hypothetical protein
MNRPNGSTSGGAAHRPARFRRRPSLEQLEERALLTSALADIAMISATTHDSRSVSVSYDVVNGTLPAPVSFTVYRSATPKWDGSAILVGSTQIGPGAGAGQALDQSGQIATAEGQHQLTLPLPGGLPPNPGHPYVLVVADAAHSLPGSNPAIHTAEFRTHVIGVITHGGAQPKQWKNGPPWEIEMAAALGKQGYDKVIPFNWVTESNQPGAAVREAPRLANEVAAAASQFPATDPVDVQFIGHSEGVVVNSLAIVRLASIEPPPMQAGYLEETMLDPHAATNAFKGPQYSVASGLLGDLARSEIKSFQAKANDPVPFVPSNVDRADVFFQHTPVSESETRFAWPGTIPRAPFASPINIWGQVPVVGRANYFDLTARGISHAGKFGVQDWYRANVVPTLGEGAPVVAANTLTIESTPTVESSATAVNPNSAAQRVTYSGTAAPGAAVRLFAIRAGARKSVEIGDTVTNPDGAWILTTRPLAPGRYQVKAEFTLSLRTGDRHVFMRPTAWAQPLTIAMRPGGASSRPG